jgi:flagellar hook capping protein FlgD
MPSSFRARRALVALAALMLICLIAAPAKAAIPAPPGGPILVVTTSDVATASYYPEILRAEGLNEFDVKPVAQLSAPTLSAYDTVVLAASVTATQADALSAWVTGGGNLVAMRPGPQLASLLGLTAAGGTLSNGYLKVDTSSAPGTGIVGETIQYHGAADRYTLTGGAHAVATLYSSATTATSNPAVTQRDVGSGHATAFTYDLAQSIYLTRQGNPAWVGQDHDDDGLTRAVDMFQAPSGGTDWLNRSKIAIPQADEQQRLLANVIVQLGASPLPRFWYLPRGDKAEVVLTGDDHGSGETSTVFDGLMDNDPAGGCTAQELADWECVRATSYAYPSSPVGSAADYQARGFELALHLALDDFSSCSDFGSPPALPSLDQELTMRLGEFASAFPGVSAPSTIRTHCIPWSDWDSQPKTDLAHGIRMNTDYYWFSNTNWDQDLAGMFTGSGMPMRFAAADGSLIDVYQAATYSADDATDDPDHVVPAQTKALIDNALGAKGYYGAFSVIVHNDGPQAESAARDQVVAYARSRGVSVISERQLLTWLDGRDGSSFANVDFGSGALTFTISASSAARGLQAMVPLDGAWGQLQTLTRGGSPVSFTTETIKGVDYAVFAAAGGSYRATYSGTHAPQTTITQAPSDGTSTSASIAFNSSATGSTFECKLDGGAFAACTSAKSYSGLALGTHTFQVRATDTNGTADPTPATASWTITAAPPPNTTITQAPSDGTSTSASIAFASSVGGSTFECALDGGAFAACTSPRGYTGLALGDHTFLVRATAGGVTDPTPASASWTISTVPPPNTTITQAPSDGASTDASIAFASSVGGSTFECKLDGGAFAACTSPKTYTGLAVGAHAFQVRASANGATDPSPAAASWTITAPPPSGGGSTGSSGSGGAGSGSTAANADPGTKTPATPLPFLTTRASSFRPGSKRLYTFTVRLQRSARIVLRIRDAHGKVVREIRVAKRKAGTVTVRWNGRDRRGRFVAAASYRYTLTAFGTKGYRRTATGRVQVLPAR